MAKTKKPAQNDPVIDALNQQVANWTVLYMKIHNYHWNITGHHFFALHVELEKRYNEAGVYLDDIAERIKALGGTPISTLKESLEVTTLKEGKYGIGPEEMIKDLISDYQKVIKESLKGKDTAEANNDDSTADMIDNMITDLQKHIWMFNAYIG